MNEITEFFDLGIEMMTKLFKYILTDEGNLMVWMMIAFYVSYHFIKWYYYREVGRSMDEAETMTEEELIIALRYCRAENTMLKRRLRLITLQDEEFPQAEE